ncbi:MAG: hypothetical protein PF542_00210 [Nanoarchaeota archaeon]|jgi:mRNA-degrading endonuclease RelE of RelBE toxin-antitoxin system|nr:hypothetical protein [Nanoarchaeota archaeon]
MTYAVYITESFEKKTAMLSEKERRKIKNVFLKLKNNPYIGDAIRYKFFREKRIKEKRIYYLIYEDLQIVLVVAFGGKKTQQRTINEIIRYFPEYRKYVGRINN